MSCPCGIAVEQPWRTRRAPFSPASLIGGFVLIAFAVVALVAGLKPWVGWLLVGIVIGCVLGALVAQAVRGHRGGCLLRRALWFGVALPGAPVRFIFSIG